MGWADASGRNHIVIALSERVDCRDDLVLDIRHDPRLPKIDAYLRQIFGDIAQVAVLRTPREDLVADHQDGSGYIRRFHHRQVASAPSQQRNPPQSSARLA